MTEKQRIKSQYICIPQQQSDNNNMIVCSSPMKQSYALWICGINRYFQSVD